MKKKIILFLAVLSVLACMLAISVSAANMANYCSVKLTLVNGETVTAYCSTSGSQLHRDNLYKTPDNAGEAYNWEDVVVFDCRDQEVVGSYPRAFEGTVCNAKAINVTTVYLSDYFTYFLNSTFTSGWKSLETVYISKTVTELKGFGGSPVKTVVIPQDSELTTLGGDAFNGCTQLVNIDISHCDKLTTIGYGAFRGCTGITSMVFPENVTSIGANCFYLSNLGGTVVVPNKVTTLGEGAFLSTKIETLILGESVTTIKYNFAGTLNSVQNQYLKNVYLPANALLGASGSKYVFFKCANPVNFYVVGSESECAAMLEVMKSQSAATGYYMNFITADEATESTGAGYGIVYTCYNRCDAFYGSEHAFESSTNPNSCMTVCTRCGKIRGEAGEHSYFVITEEFVGERYISTCTVVKSCGDCGYVASTTSVGKIVTWLGYSVPEKEIGGTVGVSQSFYIDKNALAEYENATEQKLDYGIVAANGANVEPITVVDGVTVANGSIVISMVDIDCFEIKICGIGDTQYNVAVVFNAYFVENGCVYYVSDDKTATAPQALSYNQIVTAIQLTACASSIESATGFNSKEAEDSLLAVSHKTYSL